MLVCFLCTLTFATLSCAQTDPSPTATAQEITTFEECVTAGYPITRSLPAQCIANGKVFVDTVVVPEIPNLNKKEKFCTDMCGNGICEEIVCMAIGCPCPENENTCPADCK